MNQTSRGKQDPQVGWWATICCHEDLYQIKDSDELKEHLEYDKRAEEDGHSGYEYWPTQKEAIEEIATRWEKSGYPEVANEAREKLTPPKQEEEL